MPKVPRYITHIVLPYALFASLWILLSDRLLVTLVTDFALRAWLQTYKGLAFVAVTSLLLYGLLRREKAHRERFKIEQERLRNRILGILENISDGFVALDCNWNYQYINRRAGEFLGREPGDLIGKNIWEEFPEGVNQNFYHAYQRVMRTQQPETIEELYPPWQRWFENRISPTPEGLHIFFQEITTRKQAELWREGQSRVLERIVAEHSLPEVLETLIYTIESQGTNALGSVMLLDADGQHLHYGAGPSLPSGLALALESLTIGPAAGACGTAAYTRELVIIEDFQTDPRGVDYRALAAQLNLHACWSQPIFSASGQVLGTFAMYYTEVRAPSNSERRLIAEAGHLAAVAIEAARNRSALLASETRFRATFEQAAIGIAHVSPEGKFLRINQKFCDIVGYPLGELLALTFQDITHPDDLDADLNQVKQVLLGTIDTYSMEKRYRRKDGELIWIHLTVSLVHKDDASPDYFISVIKDIRDRMQAEEALRQRDERFQIVARATNDALWDWDLAQNRIWWSEGFTTLFAYAASEIEPGPESWINRIHPDDVARVTAGIHAVIDSQEQSWSDEYRFRRRDGIYADIFDRGYVIRNAQGQGFRMIGAMQDITLRKQAEANLRASEERLRLALDAAQMGTFDWDIPCNQVTWSHWHEVLWGFKPGEFGGTYEAFAARVYPNDLPGINFEVERCISDRTAFEREFRVVWPDQSIHWISVKGEFAFDVNNQPLRMRGTVIEITQRRLAIEALRQSEEHFRTIFEQAMDGILITDADAQFIEVNNTLCQMLGYSRESFMQLGITDIIAVEELQRLEHAIINLKLRGQVRSEWRLRRQDGREILAEISSIVLLDGRLQGFVRDITDRRRLEDAQKQSEQRLRNIIDGLGPNMFVGLLTPEGIVLEANQQALAAAALKPEDVLGKLFEETYWFSYSEEIQRQLRDTIVRAARGEASRYDLQIRVTENQFIPLDFSVQPFRDASGKVVLLVPSAIVISERKQAEAEIRAQLEELLRWQQVTLGREGRVQELKAEVNQLLAAHGQPARYTGPKSP